jgi:hypothetical protein
LELKTYDKEGWWAVCKEAKPDLTRDEFEFRWNFFVMVAKMQGMWRKV